MKPEQIAQLEKLAKVFNTDSVLTPEDIVQVVEGLAKIIKVERENIKGISDEHKQTLQDVINTVSREHDKVLESVEKTSQMVKSEATEAVTKALEEVKRMCAEVMGMKPKDGEDADENEIVEKVLEKIVLPEYKETVLDDAEKIKDKLETLKDDARLDKSAIKGLEKNVTKEDLDYSIRTLQQQTSFLINRGGVKSVIAGTNVTVDNTDPQNPIVSATGSGGGGTWGSITGTLSNQTDLQTALNAKQGTITLTTTGSSGAATLIGNTLNIPQYSGGGTPGGSDTQLQRNNAGVFGGISGATSDGTTVTYTTGNLVGADVKAASSAGLQILSNAGTVTALFGAGGGANSTFYGGSKFDYATASTIAIFDGSKNLISAATSTYPSLTELSYVKGVTSAIQTQLDTKLDGSLTATRIPYASDANTLTDSANFSFSSGTNKVNFGGSSNAGAISTASGSAGLRMGRNDVELNVFIGYYGAATYQLGLSRETVLSFSSAAASGDIRATDTGFSRLGAASVALGNGSPSDTSGTFTLSQLIASTSLKVGTDSGKGLITYSTNTISFAPAGSANISLNNSGIILGQPGQTFSQQIGLRNEGSGTDYNAGNFTFISGAGTGAGTAGSFLFQTADVTTSGSTPQALTTKVYILGNGNVGFRVAAPTARIHSAAGTAAAGTAPLKIDTGTAMTTPEDGAFEYHSSHLYFTIGSTRYQLDQQSGSSGLTIGTSTITSGTNTRILYNNAGVVGEYTLTGTGTVVAMQTSPVFTTPNIGAATATTVAIGTLNYTPTNALITSQQSVNSYSQNIIQNTSAGTTASSDYIVNNSLSTDSTFYGNFGMNSSGFTGTGALNQPSYVYLTSTSSDLAIGTTTAHAIHFVVNSGTTDAMTISSAGAVTIPGVVTMSGLNSVRVSSSGLTVRNPANTFSYTITGAAIAAARTLNLPLTTGTDTLACLGIAQTFTGVQTFTSPETTTSITTGSTSFTAWAGATTLLTIGGTGASASMFAPSTLDATSSTTGAIRTSGGISAAKAANIGTTLTVGTSIIGPASFDIGNTVSTTVNAFGAATTLTVGGTPTTAITHNYSTNATATATTKTVNLGTGGAAGSTTNVNIGATAGGTTLINSPLVSFAGNIVNGFTSTATAAGTTALTITSAQTQIFTGSTTQTVTLPTTSVVIGQVYKIINNSTGNVTVQSSGANTIQILGAGMTGLFTALVATPTTAANWRLELESFTSQNIAQTAAANAATVNLAHVTNSITNNSAATLTITLPTAGAIDGEMRMVRVYDFSAVAQTITWVNTENSTVSVPTTSNGSTTLPLTVGFMYNNATSKWRCVASC